MTLLIPDGFPERQRAKVNLIAIDLADLDRSPDNIGKEGDLLWVQNIPNPWTNDDPWLGRIDGIRDKKVFVEVLDIDLMLLPPPEPSAR